MSIVNDYSAIAASLKEIEAEKNPSNPQSIRAKACNFWKQMINEPFNNNVWELSACGILAQHNYDGWHFIETGSNIKIPVPEFTKQAEYTMDAMIDMRKYFSLSILEFSQLANCETLHKVIEFIETL